LILGWLYSIIITLYARVKTEEIKNSDGTIYKMGEERNGVKIEWMLRQDFINKKRSPSSLCFITIPVDKTDKITGEVSGSITMVINFQRMKFLYVAIF
jgi:hypothetical protein